MNSLDCPQGHGAMQLKAVNKEVTFKGVDLIVDMDRYVCPTCGLEAGTAKTAGALQQAIADAYEGFGFRPR